jgi:SAM-dependent methyltransferase
MSMSPEDQWREGYVVEKEYTHGFYRELSPAILNFVSLLGKRQTIDLGNSFAYIELGCGNGHTLNLLAACHPYASFFGIDFNATHIRNARSQAEACGVENATFVEASFGELAEHQLPSADIIGLHGVYSWINETNRQHVLDFIARKLDPEGIVYISYNCLPGHAQVIPLQRFLSRMASSATGSLPERAAIALEVARQLNKLDADFFAVNPIASKRLKTIPELDPGYALHEYFNQNWTPFYHEDVAKDMWRAGLTYAGSADILHNFPQFTLTRGLSELLRNAPPGAHLETLKDYAHNTMFRRDIFTCGQPISDPIRLGLQLADMRFALSGPRSICKLTQKTPVGPVTLHEEVYVPILDMLSKSSMTFQEMLRAPEISISDPSRLRMILFGLIAFGSLLPALPRGMDAVRRAHTDRYNAAILAEVKPTAKTVMLASPLLGTGIPLLHLDAHFLKGPSQQDTAVEFVLDQFTNTNVSLSREISCKSVADLRQTISSRASFFFDELLPFLRLVGVA